MLKKEYIVSLIDEMLSGDELYLVDISVSQHGDIKIYVDCNSGVTAKHCASISRRLKHQFEIDYSSANYSMEVSSPGVDHPLTHYQQYVKHQGRELHVTLEDGTHRVGILLSADRDKIVLNIPVLNHANSNVKTQVITGPNEIPFIDIKSAQVIVKI